MSNSLRPHEPHEPGEISLANSQSEKKKVQFYFLSKIVEESLIYATYYYRYLGSNEELNIIIFIKHDNLL